MNKTTTLSISFTDHTTDPTRYSREFDPFDHLPANIALDQVYLAQRTLSFEFSHVTEDRTTHLTVNGHLLFAFGKPPIHATRQVGSRPNKR